jgi:hypothetical protein
LPPEEVTLEEALAPSPGTIPFGCVVVSPVMPKMFKDKTKLEVGGGGCWLEVEEEEVGRLVLGAGWPSMAPSPSSKVPLDVLGLSVSVTTTTVVEA